MNVKLARRPNRLILMELRAHRSFRELHSRTKWGISAGSSSDSSTKPA